MAIKDIATPKSIILPATDKLKDIAVQSHAKTLLSSIQANHTKVHDDIETLHRILAGTDAMNNALDMGTQKINNVVDPAAAQDAATKKYVDDLLAVIRTMALGGTGAALVNDPGGILYCGATVLAILANDAGSAKFLRCSGTGAPVWDTVDIVNETNGTLTAARGGTGATAAANAANGVAVLGADGYLANDLVDTTALKTATSESSQVATGYSTAILTGGQYCFFPQLKNTIAGSNSQVLMYNTASGIALSTSYVTQVSIYTGTGTLYIQARYVTASGEDLWIWLLVDKTTKEIISARAAPDHVSYGNGGNAEKLPHPFGNYDEAKHEIVLVDKETCDTIRQESKSTGKSILTIVNEDYKPDMTKTEPYQPLHSGKFLNKSPVMIETIPDYIKVRGLKALSAGEKKAKETLRLKRQKEFEEKTKNRLKEKESGLAKLAALGLTKDELGAMYELRN